MEQHRQSENAQDVQTTLYSPSESKNKGARRDAWRRSQSFRGRQKRITRHRLWLLALIILYQVFIYPIGTALMIGAQNEAHVTITDGGSVILDTQQSLMLQMERQEAVSNYLGLRQIFWWVPLIIGVIVAIAEFSFLFSMVKMDFYESQPISRRQRFRDLWLNGVLLFTLPQWIIGFLGILVAAGMGAMTSALLLECVLALLINTVNYLAVFSVAALACTLCGNGVVAACLAGFFLLAEPLWKLMSMGMSETYFVTYNSIVSEDNFYFTPVMNAAAIASRLNHYFGVNNNNVTIPPSQILSVSDKIGQNLLANLVIFIAAALLARWAYVQRRSESAGASVLYLPLREVVRILISATAAVLAGYVVNTVTRSASSYQHSSALGTFLTVLIMIIVGVVAAGVVQCIYEFSLQAFFHELWSMVFAVALGGVVLAAFAYDLTGYNKYVPKAEDVAWAAISFDNNFTAYHESISQPGSQMQQSQYLAENMHLTGSQVEALTDIARQGQAYLVDSAQDLTGASWDGYYATVTYYLKNGSVRNRNILIPYNVDKAKMDDILSSSAYKEALYPVYQNDATEEQYAQNGTILYTNGLLQKTGSGELYKAFREAYKKDLAQYSFTLASTKMPIGIVGLVNNNEDNTKLYTPYFNSYYEVYPEYTNTLTFLREHDLYLAPFSENATEVASITVADYDSDIPAEEKYTAQDKIRTILEACENYSMATQWYPDTAVDYTLSVFVEVNNALPEGEESADDYGSNFYFKTGQVPAFVEEDLGLTGE